MNGIWKLKLSQQTPGHLAFVHRSVRDAVKQRTDQLSPVTEEVLRLAAVAGQRFDFTLLQQALSRKGNALRETELLQTLKELIAAQLIIDLSADQFAFRHALIREAIYQSLLARERRLLHQTIAETLEHFTGSAPLWDRHLDDLAFQFYEAGDWDKAVTYGQRAGERHLAMYAPGAAIIHLTHALVATERGQIPPASKLFLARGQGYAMRGEFEPAKQDFERALALARSVSDGIIEWESMMALGLLWAGRDYSHAGDWFQQASDRATHFNGQTLRARSLNRYENWLVNTGRIEEGLQAHHEALIIFEDQELPTGKAETFDLLAICYGMLGDRVQAVKLLGQAITLFRDLGNTHSLASSMTMRTLQSMPGACETTLSPLRTQEECMQDAAEALSLAQKVDSLSGQVFAENALANTLLSFSDKLNIEK